MIFWAFLAHYARINWDNYAQKPRSKTFLIFRNYPFTISRWDGSAVSVPSKFFLF